MGLLLCGIVVGPHVPDVFPLHPSIAAFFSDLGKRLLMFFAGLDIDLTRFRPRSLAVTSDSSRGRQSPLTIEQQVHGDRRE